jgi:hypothetical protein
MEKKNEEPCPEYEGKKLLVFGYFSVCGAEVL